MLVCRGDELLLACPLRAGRLYDEDCLRVSVEVAKDTIEQAELPLAGCRCAACRRRRWLDSAARAEQDGRR